MLGRYMATHTAMGTIADGHCAIAAVAGGELHNPSRIASMPDETGEHTGFAPSPSGIYRPLDTKADGPVPGEAFGAIILACEAASQQYGKLAGRSFRLDSPLQPFGFKDPDKIAQAMLAAYESVETAGKPLSYVHPHAMGAVNSDIPELMGITDVIEKAPGLAASPVVVAGHKANFGYASTSAGITAVIASALVLVHRSVPVHLNVRRLSEHFQDMQQLLLPTQAPAMLAPAQATTGSVSGLSATGENVHLVLQEAATPGQTLKMAFLEEHCHLASLSGTEQTSSKPVPVCEDEATTSHPSAQPFSFIRFEEDESSVEVMVLPLSQMSASPVHAQEAVRPTSRFLTELQH